MLGLLGVVLSSGAACSTQGDARGWFGQQEGRSLLPRAGGIARGAVGPQAGCFVLADDGILGASPVLLAGAMGCGMYT